MRDKFSFPGDERSVQVLISDIGDMQQVADPHPTDNASEPRIEKQEPGSTKYKNTEKLVSNEDEQRKLLTKHKCQLVLDASSKFHLVCLLCSATLQKKKTSMLKY